MQNQSESSRPVNDQADEREFGFETRQLHAGHIPDQETGSRAVPIYQTTSYVFEDTDYAQQLFELKQYGNIYTRINNPTTAAFEERVASLEHGTGAVATSSGMAAQFNTFMTLLSPGDEIVASSHLYGGTHTQLTHTIKKLSVDVTFVEPNDFEAWEQAITSKTKFLYGETIGNPRGSILDIERLADLAHANNIPLVVDNTFATPYLCQPIEYGADIIVHSATKFIGGHGNSIAGVIVDSGEFDYSQIPEVSEPSPSYHGLEFYDTFGHYGFLMKARAESLRDTGSSLSPFNAFLLLQGLDTLSVRMDRHVENAQALAEYLNDHSQVKWVSHAGLSGHEHHDLAQKYLPKGPGAIFTFGLKAGERDARELGKQFIESLQLFSHLANVGDARSLVIHPASTTHHQLTDEELKEAGVGPGMIRLSVGLETVEDLQWDLDQAFRAIST